MFVELPDEQVINSDHIVWYGIEETQHRHFVSVSSDDVEAVYEWRTYRHITIKMTDGKEYTYQDDYVMIDTLYYHLQKKLGCIELRP